MKYLLTGLVVCTADGVRQTDVFINQGRIAAISPMIPAEPDTIVFDFKNCYLFPGFVDVHVHLREPGFSYKETVESGTYAAARGGYTSICTMPNLKPAPDNREHLNQQLEIIAKDARVRVFPYGTITVGEKGKELADMEGMAEKVVAFSDDGRGVQNELMMKKAMETAVKLDKLIAAHCEDEQLLHGGYIHDGVYAMTHGHQGISSESEWGQIARDLELVRKTGCAYHVCHISTKESVELMRKAKSEGLDVSCETAPHYLVLCDEDLKDDGRFKMNPPIRDKADREALLKGLKDGTIDMIATDHAPHSEEEKSKGLKGSMMGIVGLETAFPILYTKLVKAGLCTLEQLVQWFHTNPAKRFKIGTPLEVGQPADLTIYDLERAYDINPAEFKSKGRSTPFAGEHVWGFCKLTMVNGTIVWEE